MQVLVKHWCKFAVKGGGHSANPDDSVSAGGVTIDLGRMKSTTIMPGGKSVKLGGGHTLQTIYEALEPYNLSITGGNAAGVGLGGYALGGGISHFSPKYGLAVDNILEYEVRTFCSS